MKFTPEAVTSPVREKALFVARVVAVVALPVKAPVTFPSKSATSVPFAYPVPEVFTVVVGCTCKSLNICHLPESSAFLNIPEYLSVPPVSYNP